MICGWSLAFSIGISSERNTLESTVLLVIYLSQNPRHKAVARMAKLYHIFFILLLSLSFFYYKIIITITKSRKLLSFQGFNLTVQNLPIVNVDRWVCDSIQSLKSQKSLFQHGGTISLILCDFFFLYANSESYIIVTYLFWILSHLLLLSNILISLTGSFPRI